jgi:uncharacterized protein YqhQ
LLVVVVVSVLLFSLFGWPSLLQRILMRLALLPLVAGLAYEVVRMAGRVKSPFLYPVILPGLLLQRLTTGEPDDSQLEVALAALKAALGREGEALQAGGSSSGLQDKQGGN